MVEIFFIVNLLLYCYLIALFYGKISIMKVLVLGVSTFFSVYVIAGGFLFWLEQFSIKRNIALCILLGITGSMLLIIKEKKVRVEFETTANKKYIGLVFCILLALVGSFNKFEYFGMGQDQGVYQTKAIEFISDNYKTKIDLEEFYTLSDVDKETFDEHTKGGWLGGLYRFEDKEIVDDVSSYYHGIPTFAALLALFGKIFGMANMMHIQTVFYILSVCYIFLICENLNLNEKARFLSTFIFTISPVVLWISKSAFTEMFLCVIILQFILFITDNKNIKFIFLCFPIATFSFFHITIYTIMPLFILIYIFLIITNKNINCIISATLALISYVLGFFMMKSTSIGYTLVNYDKIYILEIINRETLPYFIIFASILAWIIIFISYRFNKQLFKIIEKIDLYSILKVVSIFSLVYIVFYGIRVSLGDIEMERENLQSYYYGKGIISLQQLTLFSYFYATLGIVFLVSLKNVVFTSRRLFKENNSIMMLILFTYCILIYSVFMRKEVHHYYYYSRYLVPFIPIVTIVAGICLNKCKKIIFWTCIISFVIAFPYNRLLIYEKDDSKINWSVIELLASEIKKEDTVLIDTDLINSLYLPLRSMTKASIYPDVDYNDKEFLKNTKGKIFILAKDEINTFENRGSINQKIVNFASEDKVEDRKTLIPYPLYFSKDNFSITLVERLKRNYEYIFSDKDNFEYRGFSDFENHFRWCEGGLSGLQLSLDVEDYRFEIYQGTEVPKDVLENKNFEISFYLNGNLIKKIENSDIEEGKNIELFVSRDYVLDGMNSFQIKYDPWSPSEFGNEDKRNLGIAISKIIVNPKNEEYVFIGEDYNYNGFSDYEDGYRWAIGGSSTLGIEMEPKQNDYKIQIHQGVPIPTQILENKDLDLRIYVNENFVQKVENSGIVDGKTVEMIIPQKYLNKGLNIIEIKYKPWSPVEYGGSDDRELGIAIQKVTLEANSH